MKRIMRNFGYGSWGAMVILFLFLSLLRGSIASALDIEIGGGPPLDLSRATLVYEETFDAGQPPDKLFWGVLDVGEKTNDSWRGSLAHGLYTLENTTDPGSVRYYYRQRLNVPMSTGVPLSQNTVCVEVSGEFGAPPAGGGLLFGFNPKSNAYFAFVRGANSSYAVYRRSKEGLRRVVAGKSDASHPHQADQLAIAPQQTTLRFYINGTQVAKIKSDAALGTGAGILAISPGTYHFDNFKLYRTSHGGGE